MQSPAPSLPSLHRLSPHACGGGGAAAASIGKTYERARDAARPEEEGGAPEWAKRANGGRIDEQTTCAICLEELETPSPHGDVGGGGDDGDDGDEGRRLEVEVLQEWGEGTCGHAFHAACLRHYVLNYRQQYGAASTSRCPLCRTEVHPDVLTALTNNTPVAPPGVFFDFDSLKDAVDEVLALDPTGATPHPVHGHISTWDVSEVNDMTNMFRLARSFNQPLNSWDVSNVEDMRIIFKDATSFDRAAYAPWYQE